ncbi:MAG: TetR/AcrR family transcriptional regulator [Acidimicrobiales bacterium]
MTAQRKRQLRDRNGSADGADDRRDAERQARRDALVKAAIAEIRALGPGVTMEQLAKAGGVTKPILYRHFGDRDGLVSELAERFSDQLLLAVMGPLADEPDPREQLVRTVSGYVAFIEKDLNLYNFLMQQVSARSVNKTPISALVEVVAKQIAIVMGEQLKFFGRDTGAAVPWAYGIVGLVHTATDWWLQDRTMSRERFVQYLTDLLWTGLDEPPMADAGATPGTRGE